jgi:phosphatidylinositol glycan class M
MSQGGSPYDRATYRYTPLLAALLIPNQLFGKVWGKLVFSACDILIGWLIIRILRCPPNPTSPKTQLPTASDAISLVAACAWLFNPFAINVSTRGNAESTIGALVLLTLHFLNRKQYATAGAIYGLAIHFKIYPIIFSLALFLWIDSERAIKGRLWKRIRRLLSPNRLTFTAATVISLATLTVLTYLLYAFESARKQLNPMLRWLRYFRYRYGWKAIYETYLYHIVRKDPRHNFSVYFYYIYLTSVDYGTPECAFVLNRNHVLLLHFFESTACLAKSWVTYRLFCS